MACHINIYARNSTAIQANVYLILLRLSRRAGNSLCRVTTAELHKSRLGEKAGSSLVGWLNAALEVGWRLPARLEQRWCVLQDQYRSHENWELVIPSIMISTYGQYLLLESEPPCKVLPWDNHPSAG